MAEPLQLPEPVQQIIDANLGYYRALGRVTVAYVQALGQVWLQAAGAQGLFKGFGLGGLDLGGFDSSGSGAPTRDTRAQWAAASPRPASAALLLEAEAGQSAQAVFMVSNDLARTVSATVMTSDFASADGRELQPALRVQPGTLTLEPGGRALVQLTAVMDDEPIPGLSYRGEVSVPGLSDTPIAVVLRRKPSSAAGQPPASAQAEPATAAPEWHAGAAAADSSAG